MSKLTMGVVATSFKENDLRAPIHPKHLHLIDESLRQRIYMERGYGARFGYSDDDLGKLVAGMCSREEIFARCDIVLLPKPTEEDFEYFRDGQVLWGWPHCVQGPAITQLGIDKKLTFIAWEEMQRWNPDGSFMVHVFHTNNELAGYCSVLHGLGLAGVTGHYGAIRRALVISFGSTARGAVSALYGLGINDVTVLTIRTPPAVSAPIPSVRYGQFCRESPDSDRVLALKSVGPVSMAEYMGEFDVTVNCILQDTDQPMMFCRNDELHHLRPCSVIIDVSCDAKMGFEFARPTSFADPTFFVGERVLYYAVDHSPSYMWESASYEISECLLDFIGPVMEGPAGWDASPTLAKAIEIRDGVIKNPKILRFQNRAEAFPHRVLG